MNRESSGRSYVANNVRSSVLRARTYTCVVHTVHVRKVYTVKIQYTALTRVGAFGYVFR